MEYIILTLGGIRMENLCMCKDCVPNPETMDVLLTQAVDQVLDVFVILDPTREERKELRGAIVRFQNSVIPKNEKKKVRELVKEIGEIFKIEKIEIWEEEDLYEYFPIFIQKSKNILEKEVNK